MGSKNHAALGSTEGKDGPKAPGRGGPKAPGGGGPTAPGGGPCGLLATLFRIAPVARMAAIPNPTFAVVDLYQGFFLFTSLLLDLINSLLLFEPSNCCFRSCSRFLSC